MASSGRNRKPHPLARVEQAGRHAERPCGRRHRPRRLQILRRPRWPGPCALQRPSPAGAQGADRIRPGAVGLRPCAISCSTPTGRAGTPKRGAKARSTQPFSSASTLASGTSCAKGSRSTASCLAFLRPQRARPSDGRERTCCAGCISSRTRPCASSSTSTSPSPRMVLRRENCQPVAGVVAGAFGFGGFSFHAATIRS